MADPLVSVVIPTYDRPAFLDRAIETALHQTLSDLEVIVVDDGSETPYAREVVDEYPATVRSVRHDRNRGLSAARNTGIDEAAGEYVAFLDDDDFWHAAKLEAQVAALADDPGVMATCLTASISPTGEVLRCERGRPDGDLSEKILEANVVGSPSRVLVESDALGSIRFDESLPTKQDWDFYIRLCQRGPVRCVERRHCFRLIHESMSSDPTSAERDIRAVIEKHEEEIRKRGAFDRTMARYHTRVGRAFLDAGDGAAARDHLARAFGDRTGLRPAALYLLSYLPHRAFRSAVAGKRFVDRVRHDCEDVVLDHGASL